jgi:hypothetical protein
MSKKFKPAAGPVTIHSSQLSDPIEVRGEIVTDDPKVIAVLEGSWDVVEVKEPRHEQKDTRKDLIRKKG